MLMAITGSNSSLF